MPEMVQAEQYVNSTLLIGPNKVIFLFKHENCFLFVLIALFYRIVDLTGVPKSGEGFIDFIGQVHKTKEQFGQDGPICVHCSAGVGRTGVFISLSIVLERMQYEGVLDVFQTVRILRSQRPAMVQTEVRQRLFVNHNSIYIFLFSR